MAWNKRIAKRRTLLFYLEVYSRDDGRLLGRIGDLTEHGLLLLHTEALAAASVLEVSIAVPQEMVFPVTSIEAAISVKWARPDKNPTLWSMGCQFVALDPESSRLVGALIEELGFADNPTTQRSAFE